MGDRVMTYGDWYQRQNLACLDFFNTYLPEWRTRWVAMNFFDTLLNPDRDEFPNRTVVVNAANLLQVGEFQFLQLAFAHWHGREMQADEASAVFDSFMIHSDVPGWALMYARKIEQLDQANQLDDNDPDYHRYDAEPASAKSKLNPKASFLAAVVFLVGTMAYALALANQTKQCSGQFPPCVTSDEMPNQTAR
jgi:hypothetical protein